MHNPLIGKSVIHYDHAKATMIPLLWDMLDMIRSHPHEDWPIVTHRYMGESATAESMVMGMLEYENSGKQTFVVGPNLQYGFEQTDLNIKEFVPLPYDGFYIALPDNNYRLWGGPTGWHDVCGAYIYRTFQDKVPGGLVRFFIWAKENENSRAPGDDASFYFGLRPQVFEEKGFANMEEYFEFELQKSFGDGNRMKFETFANILHDAYPAEVKQEVYDTSKKIMRVLCNALVYLTTYRPSLETVGASQQKIKKLTQQMAKYKPAQSKYQRAEKQLQGLLAKPMITYLNLPIENNPIFSRTHASPVGHEVRGHYKGVRFGPKHALKRRQWIDPYPRGDDENTQDSRMYLGIDNLTKGSK